MNKSLKTKSEHVRKAIKTASRASGPCALFADILELLDDRDMLIRQNESISWLVEDQTETEEVDTEIDMSWTPSSTPPKIKG